MAQAPELRRESAGRVPVREREAGRGREAEIPSGVLGWALFFSGGEQRLEQDTKPCVMCLVATVSCLVELGKKFTAKENHVYGCYSAEIGSKK